MTAGRLELFTWGGNQNYVLGLDGDGDRALPERVKLRRVDERRGRGVGRWEGVRVGEVAMARLHTGLSFVWFVGAKRGK